MTESMEKRGTVNTCVREVCGIHIEVPKRLTPVIDLLIARRPADFVTAELRAVTGHPTLSAGGSLTILKQVFTSFGIEIETEATEQGIVFGLSRRNRDSAVIDNVIRLKMTLINGRFANKAARVLSWLFNPWIAFTVIAIAMSALMCYAYLLGVHVLGLSFIVNAQQQLPPQGALLLTGVMLGSFLLHELGHCAATIRFGHPVRRIGVGIYWLFPVMFADVSSTWELRPKQRMAVDIGGVYFQLIVCGLLAAAVMLLRRSPYQLTLQTCIVINLLSVAASLNPMLKLDGYWLFSDGFGVPNLRRRSERALVRIFRASRSARQLNTEITSLGRPLAFYSILSVLYGFLFTTYLCIVVWGAARYAWVAPITLWDRISMLSHGGHYLSIVPVALSALGNLVPLIVAPVAFVSALSGMSGFVQRIVAAKQPNRA